MTTRTLALLPMASYLVVGCAEPLGEAPGEAATERKEVEMTTPRDPSNPTGADMLEISEMVGATSMPIKLGAGPTNISFEIRPPSSPAFAAANRLPRVVLRVENIKASDMAPPQAVYLNLPPGADPKDHPDLRVGSLSMFGIAEMSEPSRDHPGDGISYSLPITSQFLRLRATPGWDGKTLNLTLVPKPWDYEIEVEVGRVSLHFE